MIRRFADQTADPLDGGLWPGRTWGDWLSPGHMLAPGGHGADRHDHVGHRDAAHGRGVAGVRRRRGAAATRPKRPSRRVYHQAYFDRTTGGYGGPGVGYRQVLNILPLAFDAVPDELCAGSRRLDRRPRGPHGGHLDCGAIGVRHLLPVLSAAGRDDLALTVLTRRSRPGWGAWFEDGESTLLESWDVDARSRNHYFLGSVSAWIQQRVGGLRLTEPGWRRFEIARSTTRACAARRSATALRSGTPGDLGARRRWMAVRDGGPTGDCCNGSGCRHGEGTQCRRA